MLKIMKYLKPYILLAIISPLLMIGEVVGDLLLPYLMSYIVNYGITGMDINDRVTGSKMAFRLIEIFGGGDYSRMHMIIVFGALMLLITLIGGTLGVTCAATASTGAQGFGRDLRLDCYKRVMSLSIEQTDEFTTGSLVTRMTNDITQVMDFIELLLRGFVRAPMFLIGGFLALIGLNLSFSMVVICLLPVLVTVIWAVLRKAIPQYALVQKRLDKVNSVVQENVNGMRVVKAYNKEDYECERFGIANDELREVNFKVLRLMAIIPPVLTVVQNLAVIAVIYIGGLDIKNGIGGMTTGSVMAAITYVTQIMMQIMMATNLLQTISRAQISAGRLNEVLETVPVVVKVDSNADSESESIADEASKSKGKSEEASSFKDENVPEIAFENVSFKYPDSNGELVLENINLSVKKGETLAVIGATGTGKTTFASLIPRFYDPTEGCIKIKGRDIRTVDLNELRNKIGYVMQKSELFSATVAENIRWGKDDATDEEVKKAAAAAQASEFIEKLHDKYDSFVAEKGASLSGGQKQRMSIARALVRKPEILIFDDSTSALDLATESNLRKAVREYVGSDTTIIMIAQRIASVMEADRIAVLEGDNTIKHCAKHEELLKVSETYRDIYDSQNKSGAFREARDLRK